LFKKAWHLLASKYARGKTEFLFGDILKGKPSQKKRAAEGKNRQEMHRRLVCHEW
jgi:hypothetical protein